MTYEWENNPGFTAKADYLTVECIEDCGIVTESSGHVQFTKGKLYGARRGKHGIGHVVNHEFVGPKGKGIKIAVWNTFITRYFRPTDRKVDTHD